MNADDDGVDDDDDEWAVVAVVVADLQMLPNRYHRRFANPLSDGRYDVVRHSSMRLLQRQMLCTIGFLGFLYWIQPKKKKQCKKYC